jgi:membrane associated rhomboid family serine protease
MAGTPDLFVVCKHCGAEVSPYVTECPYCGNRVRKRAPKIERDASGEGRAKERRRAPRPPSLGRLMPGEIPGIKADEDRRPYVTIALVLLGAVGLLVLAFVGKGDIALIGPLNGQIWRVFTTPFVSDGAWAEAATLGCVALFGTLLERRHGPLVVLLLWLVGASGGAALVAGAYGFPIALGANGGALALLAAWTVPVLLARRRDPQRDDDADLYGVLVIAVVVALLPISAGYAVLAGAWGALIGALAGLLLARVEPR